MYGVAETKRVIGCCSIDMSIIVLLCCTGTPSVVFHIYNDHDFSITTFNFTFFYHEHMMII